MLNRSSLNYLVLASHSVSLLTNLPPHLLEVPELAGPAVEELSGLLSGAGPSNRCSNSFYPDRTLLTNCENILAPAVSLQMVLFRLIEFVIGGRNIA